MLLTTTLLALATTTPISQELLPRTPLAKVPVQAHIPTTLSPLAAVEPALFQGHRLIVKFRDFARVRFADGAVTSESLVDLDDVKELRTQAGLEFRPLIALPNWMLSQLEQDAREYSGRAQPDLAGMAIVDTGSSDVAELESIGDRLQLLESVEFAYIQTLGVIPPGALVAPEDIPPMTPNYTGGQGYLGPNPGMDATYAWSQGARGANVKLLDCEYSWLAEHEDLKDIDLHLEQGQAVSPSYNNTLYQRHGTAVVGLTSAPHNGYGVSGVVPDAEVHTFPEFTDLEGYRRNTCVTNALIIADVGDVVLLEMQTVGPGGFVPAEFDPALWTIVRCGTDAGKLVVAAAGNGNVDLDSVPYDEYRDRGDSGAILVGAGTPDILHNKTTGPMGSTYGSPVHVQAWGAGITTLGYGALASWGVFPLEDQDYTGAFSGTSGASAMVAAACVSLQGLARLSGSNLPPVTMREHLIATGIPQGSGGAIGPMVNLRNAIDQFPFCDPVENYCFSTVNSSGNAASIGHAGTRSVVANNFTLQCAGAPPNELGYFLYGANQGQTPLGNGWFCISGNFYRILTIDNSDASGLFEVPIDLNAPPMGSGPGQITAGSTWNFQCWFRDFGVGSGSNTSDGLRVQFCL